jgi:hypothetical protein
VVKGSNAHESIVWYGGVNETQYVLSSTCRHMTSRDVYSEGARPRQQVRPRDLMQEYHSSIPTNPIVKAQLGRRRWNLDAVRPEEIAFLDDVGLW